MIEVPRLLKRMGANGLEHKRVETVSDLLAAQAAGWLVSLRDVPLPAVEDAHQNAQEDAGEAETPAEGVDADTDADAPDEPTDAPAQPRKRGRPRKV